MPRALGARAVQGIGFARVGIGTARIIRDGACRRRRGGARGALYGVVRVARAGRLAGGPGAAERHAVSQTGHRPEEADRHVPVARPPAKHRPASRVPASPRPPRPPPEPAGARSPARGRPAAERDRSLLRTSRPSTRSRRCSTRVFLIIGLLLGCAREVRGLALEPSSP